MDVVLVTGRHMRKPDLESHLLVAALRDLGVQVELRPWDDATAWASVPLVVVRTPWDYSDAHDEFVAWARSVASVTRLVNPVEVLEWNSHKSYLLDLANAGVPTVATTLVKHNASVADQAGVLHRHDGEIVIKPAVSVGAIGALRALADSAEAAVHLSGLLQRGDVLVQPLAPAVLDDGETSLIYFDRQLSHAIRKIPAAGDYRVQEQYGGTVVAHQPTESELRVGALALAATPAPTSYARVDLVHIAGKPAVMELEVIEPELFFRYDPTAAARFAAHIVTLLRNLPRTS